MSLTLGAVLCTHSHGTDHRDIVCPRKRCSKRMMKIRPSRSSRCIMDKRMQTTRSQDSASYHARIGEGGMTFHVRWRASCFVVPPFTMVATTPKYVEDGVFDFPSEEWKSTSREHNPEGIMVHFHGTKSTRLFEDEYEGDIGPTENNGMKGLARTRSVLSSEIGRRNEL